MYLHLFVGAVTVTVGYWHACALLAEGSVFCWGCNDHGQLGRPWSENYAVEVIPPFVGTFAKFLVKLYEWNPSSAVLIFASPCLLQGPSPLQLATCTRVQWYLLAMFAAGVTTSMGS